MSDSRDDIRAPPDVNIEWAFRDAISEFLKANDLDSLTLKNVRSVAEKGLGLPEGFFKSDNKWNSRSKAFITNEVDRQESLTNDAQPESSPLSGRPAPKAKHSTTDKEVSVKRKSPPTVSTPNKRRKVTPSDSGSELSSAPDNVRQPSVEASSSPPNKAKDEPIAVVDSGSDLSSIRDDSPPPNLKRNKQTKAGVVANVSKASKPATTADSDSDLSSVIDDSPPKAKKKQQKSSQKPANPAKAAKASKSKPKSSRKPESAPDPDQEEIRKLQGQLGKCGIRKVWGKELKKFDTSREKIAHLKGMLKDAGMEGRFSEEKARQIREEREMKADLEAIREGNELWGRDKNAVDQDEQVDAQDGSKPRRKLARGLQEIQDLLGEEESD